MIMMILNAYCIYDNKALQYHPPYFASTDAAAARAFGDLAQDPQTNVGRHPGDYSLFCVGTFLDNNARLEAIVPMRHVVDATAMLRFRPTDADLFRPAATTDTVGNGEAK